MGLSAAVAQEINDGTGAVIVNHATDASGTILFDFTGTSVSRYYGRNDHSDVVWTSSSTGAVNATAAYDPFGNLVASTGTLPATRWQSSWQDSATGLYYVIARWYAPTLGRFLAVDPVTAKPTGPQDRHTYAYGAGDPINGTDPFGTCTYDANTHQCLDPVTTTAAPLTGREAADAWMAAHPAAQSTAVSTTGGAVATGPGAFVSYPSGSVNLGAVADYAQSHYNDPALPYFGSDIGGLADGYLASGQCTDFVSHALAAGGRSQNPPAALTAQMTTAGLTALVSLLALNAAGLVSTGGAYLDAHNLNQTYRQDISLWYYLGPGVASNSWGFSPDLFRNLLGYGGHLINPQLLLPWVLDQDRPGSYQVPSGVQRGDIVFVNWNGPSYSGIEHAGVIVSVTDGDLVIAQHDRNALDHLWDWQQQGSLNSATNRKEAWVWIVQPNN